MSDKLPTLVRLGPQDNDYIFDLCQTTMRGYVEQVWGVWNDIGVRARLTERVKKGEFFALHVGAVRVGAVAFQHHDTHYQIEDLYIEPGSQNRGIGTSVVMHIIDLAMRANVPVRLRVLTSNPARKLYERLGFEVIQSSPERHFLELRS